MGDAKLTAFVSRGGSALRHRTKEPHFSGNLVHPAFTLRWFLCGGRIFIGTLFLSLFGLSGRNFSGVQSGLFALFPIAGLIFIKMTLFIGVFLVRGLLPFMIVFALNPQLGVFGTLTATFSSDPAIHKAIDESAPILLMGGGVFLLLLFFHWLFLEPKNFGLKGEKFFYSQGVWFYAIASVLLSAIVWYSIQLNPMLAFSAVVGSTAFFITHGFKENAEKAEKELMTSTRSDISKILYLEAIDSTFSIDGVLGAFAFTLSVPLILLGI
jgi:hypothetical protein